MQNVKWNWNENRKHKVHKITKNQKHFITPLPHPIYESSTDLLPQHVLRQTPWYLTRLYVKHPPTSPHSMCCARLPGLLSPITDHYKVLSFNHYGSYKSPCWRLGSVPLRQQDSLPSRLCCTISSSAGSQLSGSATSIFGGHENLWVPGGARLIPGEMKTRWEFWFSWY